LLRDLLSIIVVFRYQRLQLCLLLLKSQLVSKFLTQRILDLLFETYSFLLIRLHLLLQIFTCLGNSSDIASVFLEFRNLELQGFINLSEIINFGLEGLSKLLHLKHSTQLVAEES